MPDKELTQQEIVRAATNDPTLSNVTVKLGDRTFKVVDLPYDDYILFLSKLQPLLEGVASQVVRTQGIPVADADLNPASLIKYCADALPEMACIVCKQTDPDITPEEVKRLGKNPFKLTAVVIKQIEQNHIIADIADFFASILPLMKAAGLGKKKE